MSPEETAFAAQAAAEEASLDPSRSEAEITVQDGVVGGMAKAELGPTNDHLQGKPRKYIVQWLREHGLTPKY